MFGKFSIFCLMSSWVFPLDGIWGNLILSECSCSKTKLTSLIRFANFDQNWGLNVGNGHKIMTPILQMESMKQGEIINISSCVAHTCSYMYWSTPKFVSYTGRYKFSSFVKVTLQQAYIYVFFIIFYYKRSFSHNFGQCCHKLG